MIILYNNEALNATITGTYSSGGYTALAEPVLSSVAFFETLTAQYIIFDNGTLNDTEVEYVCLYGSNLSDDAIVYIQGNTKDVWTSPAYSLQLTSSNKFSADTTTDDGDYFLVDENGDYVIDENGDFVYGSYKLIYQFWRLYFSDSANPDGILKIPWFFYGKKLVMPGMETGQIITRKSNAIVQKTSTGQLYGSRRLTPKSAKISFTTVDQETKNEIEEMLDYTDLIMPFIIIFWENDLDVEPPLFASLVEFPEWQRMQINGLLWNMTINIEECF